MTTAITGPTTANLAFPPTGANSTPSVLSDSIRARLKANTGVQLTLRTTEGDTVTISGRSSLRMSYSMYDRFGGYTDTNTTALRVTFKQQLSLSVQGNLSDQELADIDHLLATIETVFNQAMTASPQEVAGTGLSLGTLDDLESISAVTGSLSYSSKLRATSQTSQSTPADAQSPDGALMSPVPSVVHTLTRVTTVNQVTQQIALYRLVADQGTAPDAAAPGAGADVAPVPTATTSLGAAKPAPTVVATSGTGETPTSPVEAVAQQAAAKIIAAVDTAQGMTTGLFDTITQFLDALVGRASSQMGSDSLSVFIAQSIRIRVVQHLAAGTPAEASPAAAEAVPSSAIPVAAATGSEPAATSPVADPVLSGPA